MPLVYTDRRVAEFMSQNFHDAHRIRKLRVNVDLDVSVSRVRSSVTLADPHRGLVFGARTAGRREPAGNPEGREREGIESKETAEFSGGGVEPRLAKCKGHDQSPMERMPKARADNIRTIAKSVYPTSAVGIAAERDTADKYPKSLRTVFITNLRFQDCALSESASLKHV